ncbi:helix-turn-helix domain-containing protein [Paenibacillus illinoisensis]|uniref:helix-turn-helix domain-containing protein n=1 Tax=Paenibacillus illinoisensis TaxID=59845 RepID=UPI00203B031A|nr:AraC family transcriptional regulator [Paenibacillus illinoisensis]MCM3207460.1 AraC family transcriptional regulator [Paenibacillus illinoisensis]
MNETRNEASSRLLYIGRVNGNPNWNFPSHMHEDITEIVYVSDGEGIIKINEHPYAVQKGDLLIYNQGVIHEQCTSPVCPLSLYYCGIANIYTDGSRGEHIISENASPYIKTEAYADRIGELLDFMYEESSNQQAGYEQICEGLLGALLALVQRLVQPNVSRKQDSDHLAVRIKEYLDENYLQHLKLQDIAAHFHMNPYYLSHVFKHKYDDSPIRYIVYRRMGEAKCLLTTTDMKVSEIAHVLGYQNANYFTILFTKTMGESPTQYKKNERSERVDLTET